jgi:hypothetical protein
VAAVGRAGGRGVRKAGWIDPQAAARAPEGRSSLLLRRGSGDTVAP